MRDQSILNPRCCGTASSSHVVLSATDHAGRTSLSLKLWCLLAASLALNGCDQAYERPSDLIVAGHVVNEQTGEWPNKRLVILFLKGEEVGRNETSVGEFPVRGIAGNPPGSSGIEDGIFQIRVPNQYGLNFSLLRAASGESHFSPGEGSCPDTSGFLPKPDRYTFASIWLPKIQEDSSYPIPIRAKNITYTIMVLPGDSSSLPIELLNGRVQLRRDRVFLESPEAKVHVDTNTSSKVDRVIDWQRWETNVLSRETLALDNRFGTRPIQQKLTRTKVYFHAYEPTSGFRVGVQIPVTAWLRLIAELESKQTFLDGQMDIDSVEINAEASPGTRVSYEVTWQEVWDVGEADMEVAGQGLRIPFRIKTRVIHDVTAEQRESGDQEPQRTVEGTEKESSLLPSDASPMVRDVEKLCRHGVSTQVILEFIRSEKKPYDLSGDQISHLRQAGVSEDIIRALQDHDAALRR